MKPPSPEWLDALSRLLDTMLKSFGPWGFTGLIVLFASIFFGYVSFQDWRKNKLWNRLLEQKDVEIQRIANESRSYRAMLLKHQGWSDDQIRELIIENKFSDAAASRKALEGETSHDIAPIKEGTAKSTTTAKTKRKKKK